MALAVILLLLAGLAGAQDLQALLAQGRAGGLGLEEVVRALQDGGMLDQVDPNLLRRIESRLGTPLLPSTTRPVLQPERGRARALERQRSLFGTRPTRRPARPTHRPKAGRGPLSGEARECQALKAENRLLKQRLVQQSQEQQSPAMAIDMLKQLQERGHFPEEQPEALEQLVALATTQQERSGGVRVVDGREVRSILITPTPTMTTLVNTVSFTTTVTKNITQDLDIFLHGRRIATHVVEQEVAVRTSSSLVSTTMEITPTPTWQTIVVTPTTPPPTPAPTPAPIDFHSLLQQKEQERLALIAKIQFLQATAARPAGGSFGGTRAQVVEIPEQLDTFPSLQQYLEQVRRQKEEGPVAQPLVAVSPTEAVQPSTPALPSTSVSTVFMSGARPGEYSTSLVTITLGTDRVRRAVTEAPSGIEVELEPSFLSPSRPSCRPVTVTVEAPAAPCQP